MDLTLNKTQKAVQKHIRRFCENVLGPWAPVLDKEHRFLPPDVVKEMGRVGIWGIQAPKKYGGAELDTVSYSIIIEEIARVCGSTALSTTVHNSVCLAPILKFGSEYLKEKYAYDLAIGKKIGGFTVTEPNAGSDAAGMQTIAVKDGNDYIVTGQKTFVTNGGNGEVFLVGAKYDPGKGTRGIGVFIIDKSMEGFEVGKIEEKLGMRGNLTSELYFDHVRVPKENILGSLKAGFILAMKTLDIGRIGIASQALGIGCAAFEAAAKYASQRKQFGRPIGKFQGISFKLAEMKTDLEAARLLIYKAASLKDKGLPYTREASMCKFFAADRAMKACREALQIFGGYGYCLELPVERYFRDVKVTEIYEGTSEIMKLIIGNHILKEFKQIN
ncbi:MAG: acyl-CoA dehydrogenase [Candidatus Lokiarchaeota archaeon]|nr:acyl-CoA dehydrogenase [Candidatus Lokiarchaeota archaeon]